MTTHTIIFRASKQDLRCINGFTRFASDTINYIYARFELEDDWLTFDVIKAVWQNDSCKVSQLITNNTEVAVPVEMLSRRSGVSVNLVGYSAEDNELTERLTTYPCPALVVDKTAIVEADESSGVSPSLFDQYIAIVATEVSKVTDMTVSAHESDEPTVEKTESGGVVHLSFGLVQGEPGRDGRDGADGSDGTDGEDGRGIESIDLTDTSGLVDTYTITYTDDTTSTYTVTNGADGEPGTTDYEELENKPDLADVALSGDYEDLTNTPDLFSGSYNDLTDKPTIPDAVSVTQITSSGTNIADITIGETTTHLYAPSGGGGTGTITEVLVDGSSVVTDGVASIDLTGKADVSDIPTNVSDLNNDAGYLTSFTETDPVFTASAAYGISSSDITAWNGKSDFSGSYTDLTDKPSIPTVTDTYSGTSSDGMSGKAVKSAIDALDGTVSGSPGTGKTLSAFSQTDGKVSATFSDISITKSQVSDFPTLATVATSGSYNDLLDKPTIPPKNVWYGTCSSAANSALKEITTSSGDFVLETGNMVRASFTYGTNVSTQVTISVDGCTAKTVSKVGGIIEEGLWGAADVVDFVYNGASWDISFGYPATTSKYGITMLSNSLDSSAENVAATAKAIKEVMNVVATKTTVTATGYIPQGGKDKILDLRIDNSTMPIYAPKEIYWATYGTTTAAEIDAELQAGHLVCLSYDNKVYTLVYQYKATSTYTYDFYSFDGQNLYRKRCTNNGWSTLSTLGFALSADIYDVYYAEYGEDSYSNVYEAYSANKKIVCFYAGETQTEYIDLTWFNSEDEVFFFSKVSDYTEITATLNSQGTWTSTQNSYAAGGSSSPSYHIEYDENTSVGYAETGTAKAGEPNYTPTGTVTYTKGAVSLVNSASLRYAYVNSVLTIGGVDLSTSQTDVVTDVSGFIGDGVNLGVKEDE